MVLRGRCVKAAKRRVVGLNLAKAEISAKLTGKLFQGIHALPDMPQRHIELEAAFPDVGSYGLKNLLF